MSEAFREALQVDVPDGLVTFQLGGEAAFTADVFQLRRDLHRLADAAREANDDQFAYIDRVKAYLQESYSVTATDGQVEALFLEIPGAVELKKKAWLSGIRGRLNLPDSTASTSSA